MTAANVAPTGGATLDALFQRAALRKPGELALIDPPNRRAFADGAPRYVTYAAADRMVSAIAGRLQALGLARDSVIGLQLPNTVENVLALLGILRAGMIAAPLPLLWRRADMAAALGAVGAKAIIAGGRVGAHDICDEAMYAAAELFSIRHVCGFGAALADGVIDLGPLLTADRLDPVAPAMRDGNAAAHVAIVTWDTIARGIVAVARSHAELTAGGTTVLLEGQIAEDATILASVMMGSFAGLALTVMPWLLCGGTLTLHHAFDAQAFSAQCTEYRCDTLVVPGALVPLLYDAQLLAHDGLRSVLAVWRAPERLASSPRWQHGKAGMVDVLVFGETGLIPARRNEFGLTAEIARGRVTTPPDASENTLVAEIARNDAGTLAMRGPMVPRHPFPPDADQRDMPHLMADPAGYADTGYPCRWARESGALEITGPPAGISTIGGYRFVQRALHAQISQTAPDATIAALPDSILSHRLAGSTVARTAVHAELTARGVIPLIAGAFRERRKRRIA